MKQKLLVIAAFVFSLLSAFFLLLIPLFLGKFYQLAVHSDSTRGKIFNAIFGNTESIDKFILLFILTLLLKFILGYFQSLSIGFLNESFSKFLRENLFKTQLNVRLQDFEKKEVGNYLLRYSGDMKSITIFLTKGIVGFANDVFFIILTLSMFYWMNNKLTFVLLLFFPLIFGIIYFLNSKIKNVSSKLRDKRSQILGFVTSRLTTLFTIKALNRTNIEFTKFKQQSEEQFQLGKKYIILTGFIENVLPFLLYIMLCALLYTAYQMNHSSNITIDGAEILIYVMMTVNIIPVFRRLLKVNVVWQNGNISFNKFLDVLNMQKETNSDEMIDHKSMYSSLSFENVSFSYVADKMVLKDFNLSINKNGIYHIKGDQGSGKSTIHKLLLGLYEPTSGKICINNKALKSIDTIQLRKMIAFASSDLDLIGKTIFEAVSYSRKEINKDPVIQILFKLGYFSGNLDDGKQLILNKIKGITSSERKTLIIARALLTNKKIILLDDPFNGLRDHVKNNLVKLIEDESEKKIIIITSKDNDAYISYDEKYSID